MQIVKQMLVAVGLMVTVVGYTPVFAEVVAADPKDAHQAHDNLDWPGLYRGFIPCADCMGIKTELALNKNHSYILITQNVGKSPREFVEKGKFTAGEKNSTLILTSRDGKVTRQYVVDASNLIQLDDKGERYSGKEAERYILRKTELSPIQQDNHAGH